MPDAAVGVNGGLEAVKHDRDCESNNGNQIKQCLEADQQPSQG